MLQLVHVPIYTKVIRSNIPCHLVDIIVCIHVGSATASFMDVVTLHRELYSRYYGTGLSTDDKVTVDEERELNTSFTSRSFVMVRSVNMIVLEKHHFRNFWLHWIEKRSLGGCWLDYLCSSGTELMMRWTFIWQLWNESAEKQNKIKKLRRIMKMNMLLFGLLP